MKLTDLHKQKIQVNESLQQLDKDYKKQKTELEKQLKELSQKINLESKGISVDRIQSALTLLSIRGEYKQTEKRDEVVESSVKDLLNGSKHLKEKYFGVKIYSGFGEQREDHKYGYGPRHGNIVFAIGLKVTDRELTDSEVEDCLYLLTNIEEYTNSLVVS